MSKSLSRLATIMTAAVVAAVVSAVGTSLFLKQQRHDAPLASAGAPQGDAATGRIERVVRDYLLANPELLIEMSTKLQSQGLKEQITTLSKSLQEKIAANSDKLFRSPRAHVAGNPEGDVTIVEFTDYNCPYCQRALTGIMKVIEDDNKVRVVLKEAPIFGREPSEEASRAALAARIQGRYMDFHIAMFGAPGPANKAKALRVAKELGLDVAKLEQDMESAEVKAGVEENIELTRQLGIEGTPFFLVGDRVLPGGPDNLSEVLKDLVADVRKNGCSTAC